MSFEFELLAFPLFLDPDLVLPLLLRFCEEPLAADCLVCLPDSTLCAGWDFGAGLSEIVAGALRVGVAV